MIYGVFNSSDGPVVCLTSEADWQDGKQSPDPGRMIVDSKPVDYHMERMGYRKHRSASFYVAPRISRAVRHADMQSLGFTHSDDFEKAMQKRYTW